MTHRLEQAVQLSSSSYHRSKVHKITLENNTKASSLCCKHKLHHLLQSICCAHTFRLDLGARTALGGAIAGVAGAVLVLPKRLDLRTQGAVLMLAWRVQYFCCQKDWTCGHRVQHICWRGGCSTYAAKTTGPADTECSTYAGMAGAVLMLPKGLDLRTQPNHRLELDRLEVGNVAGHDRSAVKTERDWANLTA